MWLVVNITVAMPMCVDIDIYHIPQHTERCRRHCVGLWSCKSRVVTFPREPFHLCSWILPPNCRKIMGVDCTAATTTTTTTTEPLKMPRYSGRHDSRAFIRPSVSTLITYCFYKTCWFQLKPVNFHGVCRPDYLCPKKVLNSSQVTQIPLTVLVQKVSKSSKMYFNPQGTFC